MKTLHGPEKHRKLEKDCCFFSAHVPKEKPIRMNGGPFGTQHPVFITHPRFPAASQRGVYCMADLLQTQSKHNWYIVCGKLVVAYPQVLNWLRHLWKCADLPLRSSALKTHVNIRHNVLWQTSNVSTPLLQCLHFTLIHFWLWPL